MSKYLLQLSREVPCVQAEEEATVVVVGFLLGLGLVVLGGCEAVPSARTVRQQAYIKYTESKWGNII